MAHPLRPVSISLPDPAADRKPEQDAEKRRQQNDGIDPGQIHGSLASVLPRVDPAHGLAAGQEPARSGQMSAIHRETPGTMDSR
jgi:hypothetical protein